MTEQELIAKLQKECESKEEAYNRCYIDYKYWKDKAKEYQHRAKRVEKELADLKTEMLHKYNFGVKVPMESERLQLKIKIEKQAEKELQEERKDD